MGCLKAIFVQVGCLVLLVAAAVLGFLYRRQVWDTYRRFRGEKPAAAAAGFVAPAPQGGARAADALARLGRRGGPAYVDLTAAEIAALLDRDLVRGSNRVFDSVEVALDSNVVLVRGQLDLSRLPRDFLGPLAGSFGGREPVEAGGALVAAPGGAVRWKPDRLRIRDFPFPRRVIPALLRSLHVAAPGDSGLALPGLRGVGDVRVTPDRVRLYRLERP
jgi:hypothetical protein